jgi:hypothetical protein
MTTVALESKQLIKDYFKALSGQPKTVELLHRYMSDPGLKEHIQVAEAGFPGYEVIDNQMVADGDLEAVWCTFPGCSQGRICRDSGHRKAGLIRLHDLLSGE